MLSMVDLTDPFAIEFSKHLIEKGADLSVKSDQEKQTAEEFAVNSNAKETIEVLKKAGRK